MDTSTVSVDQVSNMAKLLNEFGPVVVILSVFLLLFLVIVCVVLKGFMDSQKKIQEANETLMQTMLNNFQTIKTTNNSNQDKTKDHQYDEKNLVEIFVRLNNTFKLDCKKYLEKIKCERVGIYVFHNGSQSSHGLPFFKVSCISEFIERGHGISSHIKDCTGVPLAVYDDIINELYAYGYAVVRNTYGEEPTYPKTGHQMESNSFYLDRDKAKTAIFAGVYDSYESLFAFVAAEFLNEISDDEIKKNLDELREFCARIRPALEFSDYNSGKETKEGV